MADYMLINLLVRALEQERVDDQSVIMRINISCNEISASGWLCTDLIYLIERGFLIKGKSVNFYYTNFNNCVNFDLNEYDSIIQGVSKRTLTAKKLIEVKT